MNRTIFAIAALCLMLPGSLFAQNPPELATVKELPDSALPPDLDRVLRDYERAWRAGDAKAIAALFTEDGILLQDYRPPVRGRTAIQAVYEGQQGSPLRLRALAYAGGDTVGYIVGGYRYGDAPHDIGKFTITLKRAPGKPWLISSDMDNMNNAPQKTRPATATPASTTTPPVSH